VCPRDAHDVQLARHQAVAGGRLGAPKGFWAHHSAAIQRSSRDDRTPSSRMLPSVIGSVACPVAAVKDWLAAAGITEGPLFRRVNKGGNVLPDRLRAQSVAFIMKAYAARLGLDADAFSGHSLRSSFLTSAAARGASLFKMMDVSRNKSVDVLRGYVRDADAFRDHAGSGLL
jgi:hypothetical protein